MKKISIFLFNLLLILSFTGCGNNKENYSDLLTGSWCPEGSQNIMFTLFDDGTCEISGEYGAGTWCVVNENQLKLVNYYGETETSTIKTINDNQMQLSFDDENIIVFHKIIAEEGTSSDIGDISTQLEGSTDDKQLSLDNFQVDSFLNYDIGETGEVWVRATNMGEDSAVTESVYILIDRNLNPLNFLNADEFSICSGAYNGITVILDKQQSEKKIIDSSGNDITAQYADINQKESIIGLWQDATGVTVWTVQDEDTYDKHISTLFAKDTDGNIKRSWNSEEYPDLQFYKSALEGFYYVSNSVYMFDQSVVNVENGNAFCYPPSGNSYKIYGVDNNGDIYTFHNNGASDSVMKCTSSGDEVWETALFNNPVIGQYSNGLIYVRGEDTNGIYYNGFLDADNNCAINLDVNVSNEPVFIGNYSLIECENDAGVSFVTLIDNQGNMLFEPIQGEDAHLYGGITYIERVAASREYYLVHVNEKTAILNPDGSLIDVPEFWYNDNSKCKYFNGKYLVIENGQINQYDYSPK